MHSYDVGKGASAEEREERGIGRYWAWVEDIISFEERFQVEAFMMV